MWKFIAFFASSFVILSVVLAQSNSSTESSTASNVSRNIARCFQFTWLGPRYNNESVFENATCSDATNLASGVPCFQPLVVSEDGTWPDVDYIWRNHGQEASCVLSANDVCAQYTYYFNGHVENSTYMCTRAMDDNGVVIRNGCYQNVTGSSITRVCFCRSVPGGVPCNTAVLTTSSIVMVVIAMAFTNMDKFVIKNRIY